jgi:glycosyltransferase involved in cell wall biosynthesis
MRGVALIAGVVSGLGVLGSLVWVWLYARLLARQRSVTVQLRDVPGDPPGGGWPTLAVIFAARNEADTVEAAARSLLAQDYPGLEIIAVDDRSTDATGATLDALAREDPRLKVVHVRELPPGWLGKNHALQTAAEGTEADWLLLTDADVVFAPGALRKGVAAAVDRGLDHLTLSPDAITETFGERVFMAMFVLAFGLKAPPWRVEDPRRKEAMGVGAFNLVRAEAFRAVGGFRRLALSVDDDLRLGQALKFAGYTPGVMSGHGLVSVRWHVGLGGMVRGLEKNFFAALDFRFRDVFVGLSGLLTVGLFPFLGLFVGPWWARAACAAGVAAVAGILAMAEGQYGVRWYHGLFLPLGALAAALSLVRSVLVTLRNGGVRWRDHLYPLRELKAHVRQRNDWLREVWKSTR